MVLHLQTHRIGKESIAQIEFLPEINVKSSKTELKTQRNNSITLIRERSKYLK